MQLTMAEIGFDARFAAHFQENAAAEQQPARISAGHRSGYTVLCASGSCEAQLSGRFTFMAAAPEELPVVGDWVSITWNEGDEFAVIHEVLPRRTVLRRKAAGKVQQAQVLAANIDVICIMQGLDHNFNLARLERFLAAAAESGAEAIVLLSKGDLCSAAEREEKLALVRQAAPGRPVLVYSAFVAAELAAVMELLASGKTFCLIGSSGVGKSTLINRLLAEERQETREVRADDSRGRHTTTRREMVILNNGAIMIDTPGIRELGLWGVDEGVGAVFPEIEQLGQGCRFADCSHRHEPGCAVIAAVAAGTIEQRRYDSYLKLLAEARHQLEQADELGRQAKKRKEKQLSRTIKRFFKESDKYD